MSSLQSTQATAWEGMDVRPNESTSRCSYGTCRSRAVVDRMRCRKHLRQISRNVRERYNKKIDQGLCTYCGIRPRFWSVRCIICRQKFSKSLLPNGARRALRLYREAEARQRTEAVRRDARIAAVNLIASGRLRDGHAEALRLYTGIDDGRSRTYEEVGEIMNLTRERVRQLLLPSKLALTNVLGETVPWQAVDRKSGSKLRHRDRTLVRQLTKAIQ